MKQQSQHHQIGRSRWRWLPRYTLRWLLLVATILGGQVVGLAAPVHAEGERTHTVAPGENLFRIALRYGLSVQALAAANGIGDPSLIWAGQVLVIPDDTSAPPAQPAAVDPIPSLSIASPPEATPAGTAHVVRPGETLFRIARQYGVSLQALVQVNGLADPSRIQAGQVLTIPQGTQVEGGSPTPPPSFEGVDFSPAPYFRITHYCIHGHMASGRWTYLGAVAADASIFSLGTQLLIEGLGYFTVEDRFAWDGREFRLDVWVPTCEEALQRGVQYRRVFQVIWP
ncbi:MAG: LysM peptidoglycan-binding domain-containing protein [Chloroflexi bacterium]|nr:LysM peptidoglycan-binding domain-containing protein [Chloroflexota bacterium]